LGQPSIGDDLSAEMMSIAVLKAHASVSTNRSEEATMTTRLVALVLLCLMSGTAMAQQPKVTPLMSNDLPDYSGKEVLMIAVRHA
jgi:hypothetical protein